jgi:hypothetical protein
MRTRPGCITMWVVLGLASHPGLGFGQQRAASVIVGERVRVTLDGEAAFVIGSVASIGPEVIELSDSATGSRTIPYDQVDRLERSLGRSGNSRKGFFWGGGIGLVLGLVVGGVTMDALCSDSADSCNHPVASVVGVGAATGLVGGGLGALVGAAIRSEERWEVVPQTGFQDFGLGVRLRR